MKRTLEELIDVCYDGQQGYRLAAEHARDAPVQRLFALLAAEREHFRAQLVERLGATPSAQGSVRGALHRGWMNLAGMSQPDLLRECVRGEAMAIRRYEAALEASLPADVEHIVATQLRRLVEAHDRLVQLGTHA